ncbi:MAG: cellulase family glycosylhydrolase [Paracoccaceae bacterium]|nr:cellulase family glycosylhydrolase [Paracoccaceae bacterium]
MSEEARGAAGRWTAGQAWDWMRARPWICGFNYLPSVAVNFVETWHRDSFAPEVIARELGWAEDIGYTALRINLPFIVWQNDAAGLQKRMNQFLQIASQNGLSVIFCLFDDCEFSGEPARYGPQPDPIPGIHNSRAVASPGRATVMDPDARPALGAYVRNILSAFRDDPRVLMWDLYNEPGNRMIFRSGRYESYPDALIPASAALMRQAFVWAREIGPTQPLSVGAWSAPADGSSAYSTGIDIEAIALSDIVTFHAYVPAARLKVLIGQLAEQGRPMICTEWMARSLGSRIEDQLEIFRAAGVGAIQWGLVRGRTQTYLPWPDGVSGGGGALSAAEWFHDLLDEEGHACSARELDVLQSVLKSKIS